MVAHRGEDTCARPRVVHGERRGRAYAAVTMRLIARLAAVAATTAALVLPAAPVVAATAEGPDSPVGGPLLTGDGVVAEGPPPPQVAAASYVVADADTGEVLAAKAPHRRLRPASTIKALTALTLMPTLPREQVYVGTDADERVEGSKAGIVEGQRYSVHQLWQAVFLQSGNDAINALVTLGGGEAEVLERMNATARELGALDTSVVNASGLDDRGQLTSAYDLALIGRAAVRRPEVLAYASAIRAPFPGRPATNGNPAKPFQLWTQQRFVLSYDGAVGVKNGYTTEAKFTLVAASRRDGRTILVTLMKSPRNAWRDAAALSDWAYGNGAAAVPVGTLVEPASPAAEQADAAAPGVPAASPRTVPVGAAVAADGGTGGGTGGDTDGDTDGGGGVTPGKLAAWVVVTLAATVVALRTRVVLRQRRRRRLRAAAWARG